MSLEAKPSEKQVAREPELLWPVVLEIAVLRYRGLHGVESLSTEKLTSLSTETLTDTFANHQFLAEAWQFRPLGIPRSSSSDPENSESGINLQFIQLASESKQHIANWPVISLDLKFISKALTTKVKPNAPKTKLLNPICFKREKAQQEQQKLLPIISKFFRGQCRTFPREHTGQSGCVVRVHVACDVPKSVQVTERAISFCVDTDIVVVNNLFSFAQSHFDYVSCAELDILDIVKTHFTMTNTCDVTNCS